MILAVPALFAHASHTDHGLVRKIPYCDIPFRDWRFIPFAQIPLIYRESLEMVSMMRFDEMEHEFPLEYFVRENRTTFSDVPLFPEIFHSNGPKTFCKW